METSVKNYRLYVQGSDSAFVKLIRQYKDGLFLMMDCIAHRTDVAEQLMEQVFVRLATEKPRFYGKYGFQTFLYGIAYDIARDWSRKKSRVHFKPIEDVQDVLLAQKMEEAHWKDPQRAAARPVLRTLPDEYAVLLYLTRFEGFSLAQAAEITHKSQRQVKDLLAKAQAAWKENLEKEGICFEGLS